MVNDNGNGNGNGIIGMAADMIASAKENIFGTEGVLTDVNALGMERPLATINIAEQLKEQGGILSSLRTGTKKMTAARKGGRGRTGAPSRRYRPPPGTGQLPRTPQQPAPDRIAQPERVEIIL